MNNSTHTPLNAADYLNLPTPTLEDAARSLYSTLPFYFTFYYRDQFSLTFRKKRKEMASYIADKGIPWAHVEFVANDMLTRGKLAKAGIDAEKLAAELQAIRALARRANEGYDVDVEA